MKGLIAGLVALVALGVLVFFYTAKAPPAGGVGAEMAENEAEVRQAITDRLNAYEEVAVNGDLEGQLSYWTPDIRFMEPGTDLSGDELFSVIREMAEGVGETFSWSWDPIEIFVHGDVAYQIARYHESFQLPDGEPTEVHNTFFARWEKQPDGLWRISRLVAGPIDAPPEG
jgi:ketosteroid isomerase-like protein